MELIERMTKKRDRLEKALAAQIAWREDLLTRLDAADVRIAAHRSELESVKGTIEGLGYQPSGGGDSGSPGFDSKSDNMDGATNR